MEVVKVSESEYLLNAVFINFDGIRFKIGACCGGDPAATPPVWQFAYPVKKLDGVWKVMRATLYTLGTGSQSIPCSKKQDLTVGG